MQEPSHALQVQLAQASSIEGIADLFLEEMRRSVGVASFNFMVIGDTPLTEDTHIGWVDDFDTKEVAASFAEFLPYLEQEFYPVEDLVAMPPGCHRPPLFRDRSFFQRSAAYHEFYKRFLMEHHVIGVMGETLSPRVLFTFTRSQQLRDFDWDELHHMESVRALTEQAFNRHVTLPPRDSGQVLRALEATLSIPAALFDDRGNLLWISHELLARLEATHCFLARTPLLMRLAEDYRAMQSLARRALADPAVAVDPRIPEAEAILGPGERLRVRVFDEPGCRPMALVAVVSAHAASAPGAAASAEVLRQRLGLTGREAQVARQAAEGYTALNIATTLGIKESTVRVHLKRIYRKLGVLNRTQLALRVRELG
jgi:DNA-binding CsgD family transcriptional regulator